MGPVYVAMTSGTKRHNIQRPIAPTAPERHDMVTVFRTAITHPASILSLEAPVCLATLKLSSHPLRVMFHIRIWRKNHIRATTQ
jgi:hypothetical protein